MTTGGDGRVRRGEQRFSSHAGTQREAAHLSQSGLKLGFIHAAPFHDGDELLRSDILEPFGKERRHCRHHRLLALLHQPFAAKHADRAAQRAADNIHGKPARRGEREACGSRRRNRGSGTAVNDCRRHFG